MYFTDETLPIKSIKPYARNAKKHPPEQVANIAESIKQFGWVQPIVVDESGVVIIGHGRLSAAKKLGLKEAPCKVAHEITDEQARKLRLLDNKTNESEWDFDLLGEDLDGLDFDGFEIDWGIEEEEPDDFDIFQDEVPEVNLKAEPKCKRGDLWRLGKNYLICGDSTQVETIKKLMGGKFGSADVCVTDPPYNVDYEGKTDKKLKIENDDQSNEEFQEFLASAFTVMHDAMKEGAAFYVWHASRTQREFENALNKAGLAVRQQLIWAKNSLVLGRQDYQWKHEPCFYGWKDGDAHNWYNDRRRPQFWSLTAQQGMI